MTKSWPILSEKIDYSWLSSQQTMANHMRIRQLGDPILRAPSHPAGQAEFSGGEVSSVIERMRDTLDGIKQISAENGNAISAPQVGTALRVILLRLDGQFVAMVNPVIAKASEQTFEFDEECFSFYNLRAKVTRFAEVEVQYLDELGQPQARVLAGEYAGLVQHEIDHLDGIFFLDRVVDTSSVASIEQVFAEQPERLQQVRRMIDYMVG